MVTADTLEKSIITEYNNLSERSKQLFNGLRDLPSYNHRKCQTYFGTTFDIYTKLWKFQQQHRTILDKAYGLKRWEIGEIASKIAQLYYQYYLITSDTSYLSEAYAFFAAIRSRGYFNKIDSDKKKELMVKKLRYYARFIIVGLLLRKTKFVEQLCKEFSTQIKEYASNYEAEDLPEWEIVLSDAKKFISADSLSSFIDGETQPFTSLRIKSSSFPDLPVQPANPIVLREAILVANNYSQIRFSEVSVDMFKMIQALEKDPTESSYGKNSYGLSQHNGITSQSSSEKSKISSLSPHKYMLFKPTYSSFTSCLSSAFKDTSPDGVLLVYLSADGHRIPELKNKRDKLSNNGFDEGGVITNSNTDEYPTKRKEINYSKEVHCIYPADLYSYARKPLFLIVDSDNSIAFKQFPSRFGQPVVCLLSPQNVPDLLQDDRQNGNIYTLFLTAPLVAFAKVSGVSSVRAKSWEKGELIINEFYLDCLAILTQIRDLPHHFSFMMADQFLRIFILRHCFALLVTRLNCYFPGSQFYPSSNPQLPELEIASSAQLHSRIYEIATCLDCRNYYTSTGDFATSKDDSQSENEQ